MARWVVQATPHRTRDHLSAQWQNQSQVPDTRAKEPGVGNLL